MSRHTDIKRLTENAEPVSEFDVAARALLNRELFDKDLTLQPIAEMRWGPDDVTAVPWTGVHGHRNTYAKHARFGEPPIKTETFAYDRAAFWLPDLETGEWIRMALFHERGLTTIYAYVPDPSTMVLTLEDREFLTVRSLQALGLQENIARLLSGFDAEKRYRPQEDAVPKRDYVDIFPQHERPSAVERYASADYVATLEA